MTIATNVNSEYCPGHRNAKYPSIEELKRKYESYTMAAANISQAKAQLSANKVLRRTKVQQIAAMFDSKISQNVDEVKNGSKNGVKNTPEANSQIDPPIPAIRHSIQKNFGQEKAKISQSVEEIKSESKTKDNNSPKAKSQMDLPIPAIRYSIQSNFGKEKSSISSPRTKSKSKVSKNSNTFFVSEEGISKLSVKHKVQLYNQFINEMSKKNPNFIKHAELKEDSHGKAKVQAGVVNEKQAPVKHLLAKLEASCPLPRHKVSPLAWQRVCTRKGDDTENFNVKTKLPIKAKEFEDILENAESHISILTVKLQPSQHTVSHRARSKSLPRFRAKNKDELKATLAVNATSHKRNNEEMRCYLPLEAFAPPKKIRCTRAERRTPRPILYQSQQMKNLFFNWLKEREQNQNNPQDEQNQATSNINQDQLAENASIKMENRETDDIKDKENPLIKSKPRQRKKNPAPPIPVSEISPKTSVPLQTNDESESGLSLLQKITSGDESQTDKPEVKNEREFEFVKPLRPVRKKKLRRTLTWQNSESSEEPPTAIINSTDSDTEIKPNAAKTKVFSLPPPMHQINDQQFSNHPSSEELDSDLLREANSLRKIKSVYTLTAYSPSPSQEEEDKINYLKRETAENWDFATETCSASSSQEIKDKINYLRQLIIKNSPELSSLNKHSAADVTGSAATIMFDSFVDQGFETGSNDMDSPVRVAKSSAYKKQHDRQEATQEVHKEMGNLNQPIQLPQEQFCSSNAIPLKSRRQSAVYDNEPRRSSLAMQVIRENEPLQHQHSHQLPIPSSNIRQQNFAPNNPFLDMASINMAGLRPEKGSQFWVRCNNFSLAFDIFYSEAERLRMLYNIFSQKSCDNMGLCFGIDELTFFISQANEKQNFTKRLKQEYSTYWFAAGDAFIPFAGRRVSADKIKHIFEFLKTSVEDNGVVHFGVDGIEFSSVREFWNQSPKFSMDSNYSMLVGLQSGSSNGLEGRGKYAWPYTQFSYLDQSNSGMENFEDTNSGRSSVSPFSDDKQFYFATSSPTEAHPRQAMRNSDVFNFGFKNESLDHLFDEEYKELPQPINTPEPIALKKIRAQQECLNLIQEKLSSYNKPAINSCAALDALKGTPQYLQHLKSIVTKIINKGRRDGFSGCSLQELQSYMFFLSRYADMCLQDCNGHIDKVRDALLDHRAVTV